MSITIYLDTYLWGRYRWTDASPTSIDACLWFNALVIGWNTTDSELHATDAIVPLACDLGSWTWRRWSLRRCQCDESIALCEVATYLNKLMKWHQISAVATVHRTTARSLWQQINKYLDLSNQRSKTPWLCLRRGCWGKCSNLRGMRR
jgi:hypothetical protein